MIARSKSSWWLPLLLLLVTGVSAADNVRQLRGTQPLVEEADRSSRMVEGISRWLERETTEIAKRRFERWKNAVAEEGWPKFQEGRRERLARLIGAVDTITSGLIEQTSVVLASPDSEQKVDAPRPVRWPVFDRVYGEGVLFRPRGKPRALMIALPDADQAPEEFVVAQRLAASGVLVLVPALVDRRDRWSGNEVLGRFTNQPHREWIYRQAFELGRTVIGYEVQKVLAGTDALLRLEPDSSLPVAIVGYGEGGLLALHCAALDRRFVTTLVSGYFGPRERLFEEPIYRNLFGVLREFGDAELAALTSPRLLIVEQRRAPEVGGPPAAGKGRAGAAPGRITTPGPDEVAAEVARTKAICPSESQPVLLIQPVEGQPARGPTDAVGALLDLTLRSNSPKVTPVLEPLAKVRPEDNEARQRRAVRQLEQFTQQLVVEAERKRNAAVWAKTKPGVEWDATQRELRRRLSEEVIGRIDAELLPPNARARFIRETDKWAGYEVVLDVLPDVFAWGWLLIPKDLREGERRPVVVCQHGLEGLPEDVVNEDAKSPAYGPYKAFAARLAERGFIIFAPHNPYRGKDKFRMLQRQANPLGLSIFSFIVAQHDALTRWLAALPFVDPERIGFYGLSYGGKTAMRIPALLDRYCLSICSADYNEWVRKNVLTDASFSYMFTGEWEMPEWNLANVANYAEMAMLIAPRPFMVERGHDDAVAIDEWVGYEYAKVRRGYVKLGIGVRTEIEWFNGPHTINGVGTFKFLEQHLRWPHRPERP